MDNIDIFLHIMIIPTHAERLCFSLFYRELLVTQPRRWYWLEPGLGARQHVKVIHMLEAVAEICEQLFKYPPYDLVRSRVWEWKKELQKQ